MMVYLASFAFAICVSVLWFVTTELVSLGGGVGAENGCCAGCRWWK